MKTYTIWVNFSGCARYEVEANSAEEACDIAIEEADIFDCCAWDYDIAECNEH